MPGASGARVMGPVTAIRLLLLLLLLLLSVPMLASRILESVDVVPGALIDTAYVLATSEAVLSPSFEACGLR